MPKFFNLFIKDINYFKDMESHVDEAELNEFLTKREVEKPDPLTT